MDDDTSSDSEAGRQEDNETLIYKSSPSATPLPIGGPSIFEDRSSIGLQNDPRYFIEHTKFGGFFRGYVRQDWETLDLEDGLEEKKAEWIELFFDLIYVACIVRISYQALYSIPSVEGAEEEEHHRRLTEEHGIDSNDLENDDVVTMLGSCPGSGGYDFLFCCFMQFGILTISWMEQTMIETHFVLNQIMDYLLRLLFMSCVLCLGIFIHDGPWHHLAFQIAYICCKFVLVLIYAKIAMMDRACEHAIFHIIECLSTIMILCFIAVFLRGCAIDYFWCYVGIFIYEYIWFALEWTIMDKHTKRLRFALPAHIAHLSERFGMFIMLILGESIISIMGVVEFKDIGIQLFVDIVFILLTFFISFMVASLYFDSQPSEEEILHSRHAFRMSRWIRLLYLWVHQLLFFGLLAFGIGVKIAGHRLFDDVVKREWIDIMMPSYGLVMIVIALNIVRMTHPYDAYKNSNIVWVLRAFILIVMCIMPVFALMINQAIIFFVMFVCILFLNILDVEGHQKRKQLKRELKEKREMAKKRSFEMMSSPSRQHEHDKHE